MGTIKLGHQISSGCHKHPSQGRHPTITGLWPTTKMLTMNSWWTHPAIASTNSLCLFLGPSFDGRTRASHLHSISEAGAKWGGEWRAFGQSVPPSDSLLSAEWHTAPPPNPDHKAALQPQYSHKPMETSDQADLCPKGQASPPYPTFVLFLFLIHSLLKKPYLFIIRKPDAPPPLLISHSLLASVLLRVSPTSSLSRQPANSSVSQTATSGQKSTL